jgi:SAM-dependent methyltransferase
MHGMPRRFWKKEPDIRADAPINIRQASIMKPSDFDRRQADYWNIRTNRRPHDHPVVERFARQRVRMIRGLLNGLQPRNALDTGCGDGFGQGYMTDVCPNIIGCDYSPEMLRANPSPRSRLCRANAYHLPFDDRSFDLVYCWELLHHIGEPSRVVREMARTSRDRVLICEPNTWNPAMAAFSLIVREERGGLRFNPLSLKKLMQNAGLRDVRVYPAGYFTPNKTPERLAKFFARLPYRVPLVGMYCIGLGRVDENAA